MVGIETQSGISSCFVTCLCLKRNILECAFSCILIQYAAAFLQYIEVEIPVIVKICKYRRRFPACML